MHQNSSKVIDWDANELRGKALSTPNLGPQILGPLLNFCQPVVGVTQHLCHNLNMPGLAIILYRHVL